MKASLFFSLLIFAAQSMMSAQAAPFTGDVYQLGDLKKPLFRLERTEEGKPEKLTTRGKFTSLDGKPVVNEEAILENGSLRLYKQDHLQLAESGTVEVKDGKVLFQYTRNGKTENASEKATDNLIVGPNTMEFLHKHWTGILAGETVHARFAVPDRLETVGFKFFKTAELDKDGKTTVTVRMKASSIVIAALIDPLDFQIDKATLRLNALKGRTLPKLLVKGSWKDLDAQIFYHYKK
jgi:hypothetical protein